MPALVSFNDFVNSSPSVYLNPEKGIENAARYQRLGWGILTRGKGTAKMVKGGADIRCVEDFQVAGTFESYNPNDTAAASMPQTSATLIAPWRFGRANITWTEEELEHNGVFSGDPGGLSGRYLDLWSLKESQAMVSIGNGMEDKFIAVPNKDTMESPSGLEPMPLHSYINDHPNTLFSLQAAGTWTTVMQQSPTAAATLRHKNRVFGYNTPDAKPTADGRNMLNALDSAFVDLNYQSPALSSFYRAPAKWQESGWPSKVLMLSHRGMDRVTSILRSRNDVWSKPGDGGITGQMYSGAEFIPLPRLDAIEAYRGASGTTLVTEGASTADGLGPRIFIVDTDDYTPIFSPNKMFERKEPRPWPNQPTSWSVWIIVHYNYVCTKRWKCGIVTPGNVTGTFPSETLTASQEYAAF